MELNINQVLVILFPILFAAGFFGWFFRFLSNRSSYDYKRSSDFKENPIVAQNTSLFDLAYFYRGELLGEDVAPILVSWADKGFIKLRFIEKNGQKEIFLKKVQDLSDGYSGAEKEIFKCLFNKAESKTLKFLKKDNRIDPNKLAQYEDDSMTTKLNAFAGELSKEFSLLFKEIAKAQSGKMAVEHSQVAYKRLTLLELFIGITSLLMLAIGFSFMIDGQTLYSSEFYAYVGLELLLVGVYFGALYKLGRTFNAGNFLGYLGVGFLIYLAAVAIQDGYDKNANFFFANSYRYFGFIFGSLLALLAPSARALTEYGKNLRDFFKVRRQELIEEAKNEEKFWQYLPELMLYGCLDSVAKKLDLSVPGWYEGMAANQGKLDVPRFVYELERLSRELHLLAIVKR
jgi:hypothetical protein